jgi:hypothetical protein
VTSARLLSAGERVEIGREGDLAIGVAVPNGGISRRALSARATEHCWELEVANRNGAVLYPWGQAPRRAQRQAAVNWPLVALRMLPDTASSQHWVLLESDDRAVSPAGPIPSMELTQTDRVDPPGELSPAENEALRTVFEQHLSWPPQHTPEPLLLKQAAKRLGLSISGLQDRLKAARARAMRLGHTSVGGLTDPAYLYTLIRAGYLDPPTNFPHRAVAGSPSD